MSYRGPSGWLRLFTPSRSRFGLPAVIALAVAPALLAPPPTLRPAQATAADTPAPTSTPGPFPGCAAAPQPEPIPDPAYTTTDLGTLGGPASTATALNDAGEVVGWSTTAGGAVHAFLHRAGELSDLGTLPGRAHSRALGINNHGQVVGVAYNLPSGALATAGEEQWAAQAAFLWERGVLTDLGPGQARAIDPSGWQIAGTHNGRAFVQQDGVRTDLGSLGGPMTVAALECGNVVGSVEVRRGVHRAFLWNSHGLWDLGTLGGQRSAATGMRTTRAFGWAETADARQGRRAMVYYAPPGMMEDLNSHLPPGSGWVLQEAVALNPRGEYVGRGLREDEPAWFLFRLRRSPQVLELPIREGGLTGINEVGQIAGHAVLGPDGQARAILLTPR